LCLPKQREEREEGKGKERAQRNLRTLAVDEKYMETVRIAHCSQFMWETTDRRDILSRGGKGVVGGISRWEETNEIKRDD
jgi:hypothetical protein